MFFTLGNWFRLVFTSVGRDERCKFDACLELRLQDIKFVEE